MANIGSIAAGQIVRLDTNISAPAAGNTFSFPASSGDCDFSVMFIFSGTVTSLTADLQASPDGGTTWVVVVNLATTLAAPGTKVITPAICGVLYRLNYTAASGSINTSVVSN